MGHQLPRREKLKSKKIIERLFEGGNSYVDRPIKLFYLPFDESEVSQVAFAVPKKSFKSAVVRNRIKRQLRAAYQLHKQLLTLNNGKQFALLILYISKDEPQFAQLEVRVKQLLNKLVNEDT